jgi:hypothetical protein
VWIVGLVCLCVLLEKLGASWVDTGRVLWIKTGWMLLMVSLTPVLCS